MNEDYPIRRFNRHMQKVKMANRLTDETVYYNSTKNPILRAQDCARSDFPGSFAPNNLYLFGEFKQPVTPDYDRTMRQQRQYDQQFVPYISEDEFRNRYGAVLREYVVADNTRRFSNASMLPRKPGVMTPTGYRGPSKLDKEIAMAREERINKMLDF